MYLIGLICAWLILYYTIKAAVKNGILAARAIKEDITYKSNNTIAKRPINEGQANIQQRYNYGEISFETFQEEWNKFNS